MDLLLVIVAAVTVFYFICRELLHRNRKKTKSVCVVVLGDIGRSPRMQYHAISFIKEGFNVEILGYPGSPPHQKLLDSPKVKFLYLREPPKDLHERFDRIVVYFIKVIWQSFNILWLLFTKCNSNYLLLQNPPAIPTIPICWYYCLISKKELVIDWHNYAHTIMGLSLGNNHKLVKLATFIESFFGARASMNFCVTKAMQEDLKCRWNIRAKVLYDRPLEDFHSLSLKEKHQLFLKFSKEYDVFKGAKENFTIFTKQTSNGEIILSPERPGLIVSSTSWTEDEDFSILINALDDYENECETNPNQKLPNLICVITGKGPLKDFYQAIMKKRSWKFISVVTPWLENQDYPKILASADLGVCLHTSSSGLDLPMKVVDMFGCGLPVCAYKFKCLGELVKHNENSLVFSDKEELSGHLKSWFKNFPYDLEQQKRSTQFRNELSLFQSLRWHANWTNEVLPCFK